MNTYMNDQHLTSIAQIEQFTLGSQAIEFNTTSTTERYRWIANTLKKFNYRQLGKKDKGVVRAYLIKMTGYSRQQLTRLIAQHKASGWIGRRRALRNRFPKQYTAQDIRLLAETDTCHDTLSGPATKKIFERAFTIFGDVDFERLTHISVAHLYNLRKSTVYIQKRRHFTKTQRTAVSIGERRKPQPEGKPGYLRIDTVHQGDQDKVKGVYHINAVDEVTQMEIVCSIEKISERYLIPVLAQMIEAFPFVILEIHADNGSEYINKTVARLLQKLLIELTKSRSRRTNDNALVESKNGSIVRKCLGYGHIKQKWAPTINEFYQSYFNPYLNYHRPCFFPITKIDNKGKQRKTYPYEAMMTPYEKLKSIPNAKDSLKPEITFEKLDQEATKISDNESARRMHQARTELFKTIFENT